MGRGYFSTGLRWGNWVGKDGREGGFETCPYRGESEGGNVRKMDSRPRLYGGGRFAGKRSGALE